ncbi:MAG: DUF4832 domain-containing protein [Planctomycetaceae bacterium]
MHQFRRTLFLLFVLIVPASAQLKFLKYEPSPADNPLRGLVPYSGEKRDVFPHSMEFSYLALNQIVVGKNQFDWKPFERLLDDIASRGHQAVFRVWIEYPGKNGIPQYLADDGLKVTEWLNTHTDPFPRQKCWTPDYSDPRMRAMLKSFVATFGKKYDGDPRIGFITAGLLGTWGEWHSYPRNELFASKEVQTEVMQAYADAFRTTPILLRYPANKDTYHHAANDQRPFGYHDDSFAWATLDTGKSDDNWYFMPAMRSAGAAQKWKRHPIGGEIRPELWGQIFDEKPAHAQTQDFAECVRQSHATWLMDTGMFDKKQSQARIDRAIRQVQKMGYEFHVSSAAVTHADGKTNVVLTVRNTGVAPFYYDWKLQLGAVDRSQVGQTWSTEWKLTGLLPGETRVWKTQLPGKHEALAVRVINPLKDGRPLRFANKGQANNATGWLSLP